ncbi:LysR family transcriptional regulator [Sneathiella sp. HT1-7]|uniref:LysR family transcriptional regulator n=1 Tax=Sneathiella sp. HT1-7 TaxID=2887192 RepID=UPI001D14D06E|nr:LysR family transcriptional regulator [Sneathiella sp. HT1-7]MCC3306378.1 LysR family transcriptional regulator [Sneathiella sp. HT1-7]
MELAWLEDFLALSSLRIFSRAAEARNVSQPAFTRRIKNLEYWIGTPLFDRSVHPVRLTPAGEVFKPTAHEVIKSLSIAKEEARDLASRHGEIIDIVALHTLAISYYPVWISEIERSLGALKVRINAENFSSCVESLLSDSSDFMLCYQHSIVPTTFDDDRYPSIKLAEDRLIAVSAPDAAGNPKHTINSGGNFPYLAYTAESLLGRVTSYVLEKSNLTEYAEFRYENSVSEALKAACVEGLGVAWLPSIGIKNELKDGRLIRISSYDQETSLSVKLHRSIERSRTEIERLWALSSSKKLN